MRQIGITCAERPSDLVQISEKDGRIFLRIDYGSHLRAGEMHQIRCWPSALPPEEEVLGLGVTLSSRGILTTEDRYVKLTPVSVGYIRRWLPSSIPEPREEATSASEAFAAMSAALGQPEAFASLAAALGQAGVSSADLKPRGVKRQWWLFPFDAYAEIEGLSVERSLFGCAGHAASDPTELPALGAALFAALDVRTGSRAASMEVVCQVFEHGAAKYDPDNWRRAAEDGLVAFRREYFSAIMRHVLSDLGGSPLDTDHTLPDGTEVRGSGLFHLAHACCGVLMMIWHESRADFGYPGSIFREGSETE